MLNTKIVSTGMYVPEQVYTNDDLAKIMDTSDEWIQQRSGIKERRWIKEGENTASMALASSKQALERANLKADDIDMIIFGALVTDYVFPGNGVLLQKELGFTKTVPALDIRNQCSGFVYALSIADAWIKSGMYKRILICGSEVHSTSMDKTDTGRDISVLFGDAAASMIVEATDSDEHRIIGTELHSEGQYAEVLTIQKPSSGDFPRIPENPMDDRAFMPYMEGKLVFKNAVSRMCEVITSLLKTHNMTTDDVDFVIAHQANLRINQMVLKQLEIPFEKTHHTLDRYGNTTMATIPITFDEAVQEGKIKRGDKVLFVAFGAGFTWGANILQY